MYRRYCSGDNNWADGLRLANDFIAGELFRHVSTWPRYGHLGVQDGLNCRELCDRLPLLINQLGTFGLLLDRALAVQLLIVELGEPGSGGVLCYGPWPGIETWTRMVEPSLSVGVQLPRTFWNRMPRLDDLTASNPLDDAAGSRATLRLRRHLDAA